MRSGPPRPSLILLDRTLTQDQGAWVVEYRLRNTARTGVIVTPDELGLKIEGWVSNSRLASHAVPRWSSLTVTPRANPTACSDVIAAADESHRCRERSDDFGMDRGSGPDLTAARPRKVE